MLFNFLLPNIRHLNLLQQDSTRQSARQFFHTKNPVNKLQDNDQDNLKIVKIFDNQ
jgi:hypothetical protein